MKRINWSVLAARGLAVASLFVVGGAGYALLPHNLMAPVALGAIAVQAFLKPVQLPSGVIRPAEGKDGE